MEKKNICTYFWALFGGIVLLFGSVVGYIGNDIIKQPTFIVLLEQSKRIDAAEAHIKDNTNRIKALEAR